MDCINKLSLCLLTTTIAVRIKIIITTTITIITEFLVAEAGFKMQFLTILCMCSQGRS